MKTDFSRRPERDFGRGKRGDSAGGKRDYGAGKRGDFANKKSRRGSHEEGMVRLKINKGKANSIRPNDIVGQIAFHANIPGNTIGKIRIEDTYTYVDIPEDAVDQVIKHSGNYKIGKEKFSVIKA